MLTHHDANLMFETLCEMLGTPDGEDITCGVPLTGRPSDWGLTPAEMNDIKSVHRGRKFYKGKEVQAVLLLVETHAGDFTVLQWSATWLVNKTM